MCQATSQVTTISIQYEKEPARKQSPGRCVYYLPCSIAIRGSHNHETDSKGQTIRNTRCRAIIICIAIVNTLYLAQH